MKYINALFLTLFIFFLASCTKIKIFNTEELAFTSFYNKKVAIITNDTELSQEYLIHLKNHLQRLLQKHNITASAMNIRYKTKIKPNSIQSYPIIAFNEELNFGKNNRKYKKEDVQIVQRTLIDTIKVADFVVSNQAQIVINIDVNYEYRKVFYTLNNTTQELHNASYKIVIHAADNPTQPIWNGEILLERLSKMDMIHNAKITAQKLIRIFTEKNII